jgi:hypothetical protein
MPPSAKPWGTPAWPISGPLGPRTSPHGQANRARDERHAEACTAGSRGIPADRRWRPPPKQLPKRVPNSLAKSTRAEEADAPPPPAPHRLCPAETTGDDEGERWWCGRDAVGWLGRLPCRPWGEGDAGEEVPSTSIPNYSIRCKISTHWHTGQQNPPSNMNTNTGPATEITNDVDLQVFKSVRRASLIFLLKVIQIMRSPGILLAARTRTRTWLPAIVNL